MLTPDLGSSAFPISSVCAGKISSSPKCQARTWRRRPLRKCVSFAETLTLEYEIASRDCRRRLSVSVEELRNRVLHLQRELDLEYQDLDRGDQMEHELKESNRQYLKHGHVVALVKLRNSIERLKQRKESIEDDIEFLRIDTLRLKGAQKSLAKTIQDKDASSKTMQFNSLSFNLVRAFWTNALAKIDAIDH